MLEILLTRIFSFTIWYHLAYLTISTALLGFGAAGSLLAAFPEWLEKPGRLAGLASAGAGVAVVVAMALVGPRPLSPDALLSEPFSFSLGLLGYYLAVTVPFLLAGIAISAPLAAFPAQLNVLYAADLLGAGIGCVVAVVALTWLDGQAAIVVAAALLVLGGALYASGALRVALGGLAVALAAAAPMADRLIELRPTHTKVLGQDLAAGGVKMIETRWSPVNRVDLYSEPNPRFSFWSARGLSKKFRGPKPRTLSIQYDGHNGTSVYEARDLSSLRMLDQHLLRTPYLLFEGKRPEVLVIGVGGGIDVLNALVRGAGRVTGVELQPITIELHDGPLAKWTGGHFQRPEVELVAAEGRHFVRSRDRAWDLIQITAVDTFSAQTTGAYVLAESYLYTVEAFLDYLDHLNDDGVVSLVLGDPIYRDPSLTSPLVTRLALIAAKALERRGVTDPLRHMMVTGQRAPDPKADPASPTRGAFASDLLVKRTPFSDDELARVRAFVDEQGFALRLSPDGTGEPILTSILAASNETRPELLARQPFSLEPVSDDRPFFYHVLPWSSIFSGGKTVWYFPGSTIGQIMLLIMLAQGLVLGGLLILLPLVRGPRVELSGRETLGFLGFFLALGLGFMLIEISFVQKYVLVLGYPTYSLSVTIFSLLIFAALGAALSRRFWGNPRRMLATLVATTGLLVGAEIGVLSLARESVLAAPLPARIAFTVLLQLPLGITLGMYFPTGAELLRRREPRLVPWAWAVNGVGSVVSSVLAVILGMSIGFSGVALVATAIYIAGTLGLVSALRDPGGAGAGSP